MLDLLLISRDVYELSHRCHLNSGLNFAIGKAESAGGRTLLGLCLKGSFGLRQLHEKQLLGVEFLL